MRRLTALAGGLVLAAAVFACAKAPTGPSESVVTSLTCADGTDEQYVACSLVLTQPAGFKVRLVSRDCRAHGNVFRITAPVQDTLLTDGCYQEVGQEIVHAGPFEAGTSISAEVIAPLLDNPPSLRVSVSETNSMEWTLTFEDGMDEDHNDLILVLTAIPQAVPAE